jgi:hypothetical protein
MAEGKFEEAGRTYWAPTVVSIEPEDLPGGIPAIVRGFDAVCEKGKLWFSACGIEELKMEGPYVNGDQFALHMEMLILFRASGERKSFKEIAVFTVSDGKIVEERYLY